MEFKNLSGRPTKFDKETTEKILKNLEDTLALKYAAEAAEVTYETLNNWLNEGKQDLINNQYTDKAKFFHAIKKSQGDCVAKFQQRIASCCKNWQALAWLLERCKREDFGVDAGIIQDLLAKAEKMEQSLNRLESQPQGVKPNG